MYGSEVAGIIPEFVFIFNTNAKNCFKIYELNLKRFVNLFMITYYWKFGKQFAVYLFNAHFIN